MKVHLLQREQVVAASLAEVFGFFSRPENLADLTPPLLGFQILTPSPIAMKEGAVIDYEIRLSGWPVTWRSFITAWEPPHRFVDLQLNGPYAFWHHTHGFAATGDGGTRLTDEVRYALPLGPLGEIAHALSVRRQLRTIFDYRREVVARRFAAGG